MRGALPKKDMQMLRIACKLVRHQSDTRI